MKSFDLANVLNRAAARSPFSYDSFLSAPPGPLPDNPGSCTSCLFLLKGHIPQSGICPPGDPPGTITTNPSASGWSSWLSTYNSNHACPTGVRLQKFLAANDDPNNPHMPLVPASTLKRCLKMDYSKYNNPAKICGKATPYCRCCNYKVVNGNWVLETGAGGGSSTEGTVNTAGPCSNLD